MKPIPQEIREAIVSAKARGESADTISLWLKVSKKSVYSIVRLHKETNSVAPKPYLGKASRLTCEDIEAIRRTIQEKSDITLEELIEKLNLPIKKSRLSLLLISLKLSFKKRRFSQKLNNAKMSKKSVEFGEKPKVN